MRLISWIIPIVLVLVPLLSACDSGESEPDLPDVSGHWKSEPFVNEDRRGSPIGNAIMEVTLEQTGAELDGSGVLTYPDARTELAFEVDGEVREETIQFQAIFETIQPSTVGCVVGEEPEMRCLIGTVQFKMSKQ